MAPGTRRHDPPQSDTPPLHDAPTVEPLTNGTTSYITHNSHDNIDGAVDKTDEITEDGLSNGHDDMISRKAQTEVDGQSIPNGHVEDGPVEQPVQKQDNGPHGKKRKSSGSDTHSHKAARLSSPAEHEPSKNNSPTLSPTDRLKLLNFLLSPVSLRFARPKDEEESLKTRPNGGAKTRTYATGPFTPFEELLNAVILARPIGHTLGVRTIRTLLNPPYNLMSPKLIKDIGVEGVHQALEQARTQHRQKTAEEIVLLADAVTNSLGEDHFDVSLEKLREVCGHDMEKERTLIQKQVKGIGKTGLDIFARRIQGSWGEWYPFADHRTLDALKNLGLPGDTQQLKAVLDENWDKLRTDDVIGDGEESKRRVFVRVLERAIGAQLEGKLDEMKAKAVE